jgi:hypothetical protein
MHVRSAGVGVRPTPVRMPLHIPLLCMRTGPISSSKRIPARNLAIEPACAALRADFHEPRFSLPNSRREPHAPSFPRRRSGSRSRQPKLGLAFSSCVWSACGFQQWTDTARTRRIGHVSGCPTRTVLRSLFPRFASNAWAHHDCFFPHRFALAAGHSLTPKKNFVP